jgi:hypothetical protein
MLQLGAFLCNVGCQPTQWVETYIRASRTIDERGEGCNRQQFESRPMCLLKNTVYRQKVIKNHYFSQILWCF